MKKIIFPFTCLTLDGIQNNFTYLICEAGPLIPFTDKATEAQCRYMSGLK